MFGKLLPTRLRAAEKALREGRLDDAHRLATSPDLRDHDRAKKVREQLAERLLERAREHYRADRFTEALADLSKAVAGGVQLDRIEELRQQVNTVAAEVRRQAHSRRERMDAARQRIERGSLDAGRRILEHASQDDRDAAALKKQAERRADELKTLVDQARKHIKQQRWADAAERVRRARRVDAHADAVATVEHELCDRVLGEAGKAFADGRLNRTLQLLADLRGLGAASAKKRELEEWVSLADATAHQVEAGDYGEARERALQLQRLAGKTTWIKETLAQIKQLEEAHVQVSAGPLGERIDAVGAARQAAPAVAARPQFDPYETMPIPGRGTEGVRGLAAPLLLLVDGGGSYLILRGRQFSIGRAAENRTVDVPIVSDLGERHANLMRVDDDYFLFSDRPVEVAGKPTKHQLLRDGDRVVLGRRAKFTFRMPSRRSASAVLDLSESTRMPRDVRRVILLDRHATIGSGATAHVICRHAQPPLLLFERNGSLWLRRKNDGHVDTEAVELTVGAAVELGGVSLALATWTPRNPGTIV